MEKPSVIKMNMISESAFSVQSNGVHTAFIELTNALRARPDIDIVINKNRPGTRITHIQTIGPYSLWYLVFGRGKKVVTAHVVPASFVGSLLGAKYWAPLSFYYLKWFYGRAGAVLAVSKMVRDELEQKMGLRNVKLFYNTIDMSRYAATTEERAAARRQLGLEADDFVVIGNGQIQPRKRFDQFLEVAKLLPEVQFRWVGGIPFGRLGASYDKMNHLMQHLPDNVKISGVIPLEQVRPYTQAADVFFLPSDQENHPMSVLEAAGAGLAIVLKDIPEYADTFAGHALMGKTTEEFAAILRRLRDEPKARTEAKAGSAAIAQRFDGSTGAAQAVEIYRSLLEP